MVGHSGQTGVEATGEVEKDIMTTLGYISHA